MKNGTDSNGISEQLDKAADRSSYSDDINNQVRQAFLSQDTTTSDELMKLLEEKEAIIKLKRQGRLANKVHETILAIDSELNMAVDGQHRELMVKAAYAIRNLEESIQRDTLTQQPH